MDHLPKQLRDPEYLQALGGFVETFALVEAAIFWSLRFYTNMPIAMMRAVLSGVRIQDGISFVRRVHAAAKPPLPIRAELDAALVQLKLITDKRNDIIHFGSHASADGARTVSNEDRALTPEALRKYRVSADMLVGMTQDLRDILGVVLTDAVHSPMTKSKTGRQVWKERVIAPPAWRYTPEPPPKNPAPPKRGHQQSRPRQPRSSRAKSQ